MLVYQKFYRFALECISKVGLLKFYAMCTETVSVKKKQLKQ